MTMIKSDAYGHGVIETAKLLRDSDAFTVATMEEAVSTAFEHAKAGDTVLLSPACASLDMYANFAARGDHFKELVSQHAKAVHVAVSS